MVGWRVGLACGLALLAGGQPAAAAEGKLYETGPSVVSGYVRFVNAGTVAATIAAGAGTAVLGTVDGERIGTFQAVPARQPLTATIGMAGQDGVVTVTVQPDEFVTIATLDGAATLVLRDLPADFNALKATIGFFNADPACAEGALVAGAGQTVVFKDIAPGDVARRSVNPVTATVAARCGAAVAGAPLALGQLSAGGRYSLIIIPAGAGGHRLVGGLDARARY